jgi:hypothetical protein
MQRCKRSPTGYRFSFDNIELQAWRRSDAEGFMAGAEIGFRLESLIAFSGVLIGAERVHSSSSPALAHASRVLKLLSIRPFH